MTESAAADHDDADRSYLTGDDGQLATTIVAPLDPGVLTSARAADVRFQKSQPEGYYYPQVEAFVAQAVKSLAAMEERQFQTDVALHEARVENQHLQAENRRHLYTIEIFKVNGAPAVNEDGSYVTESQVPRSGQPSAQQVAQQVAQQSAADAEARAARATEAADEAGLRAARAEAALSSARQALAVAEADAETFKQYGVELQSYIEQTQAWVATAQGQLASQAAALAAYGEQGTPQTAAARVTSPVPEPAQPAYDRPTYAQPQPTGPVGDIGPATAPQPVARLRQPRGPVPD